MFQLFDEAFEWPVHLFARFPLPCTPVSNYFCQTFFFFALSKKAAYQTLCLAVNVHL